MGLFPSGLEKVGHCTYDWSESFGKGQNKDNSWGYLSLFCAEFDGGAAQQPDQANESNLCSANGT